VSVAAHDLVQDGRQRRLRHRHGDAQFRQRAPQPFQVAAFVDQPTLADLADLVDAVGELIAAVLDVDRRRRERTIAAVDIGDAGHQRAGCKDRSEGWRVGGTAVLIPLPRRRPAVNRFPAP